MCYINRCRRRNIENMHYSLYTYNLLFWTWTLKKCKDTNFDIHYIVANNEIFKSIKFISKYPLKHNSLIKMRIVYEIVIYMYFLLWQVIIVCQTTNNHKRSKLASAIMSTTRRDVKCCFVITLFILDLI
jgi:hypothetical protein